MKFRAILLISMLLSARLILATSYSGPIKQKVYSSNGKFFVVIDPQKSIQAIYRSSAPKKVYWSFSFAPEMDTWFIPDNGDYVACIRWRFVRAEDLDKPAVIIFERGGSRREHSYNSLVKARRTGLLETAPKGSFWRVWYESLAIKNNRAEISTHDEKRIVISGSDGKLEIFRD
ncbi:MAG TPA: hypothetical protein PK514_12185 [Spirochaetota bacterium]|nr:hypothetical protein [Spirochaetota bacterium]